MSQQKTGPCGPGRSGEGEAEQPQPDESSGCDMQQAMARMMAHCGCGPEMMARMAGRMGARPASKTADSTPQDPD